jgi:hypothetical protein
MINLGDLVAGGGFDTCDPWVMSQEIAISKLL